MVGSYIYFIASLLTILIDLSLAIFVISKNIKNIINRIFAILMLAISAWAFGMCFHVISHTYATALFWGRFLHFGSIFVPPLFLYFVLALLNLDKKESKIIIFAFTTGFLFIFLNFTDLLIKSVSSKGQFIYLNDPGLLYPLYILYFGFFFCCAYFYIIKEYKILKGIERNQIIYVFFASLIGIVGSITTYLAIYNIFGTFHYPLFFGVSFYNILTAYAITKHELMDIRVAITRSVAYGLVGILLVASFIALNTLHLPMIILIVANSLLGLFWALAAHRLRAFIQTPLEEKWITGWYDPERLINAIAQKLAPVIDRNEALKIITEELKGIIKIKNVEIILENTGYDENNVSRTKDGVAIPLSSSNKLEAVLLLGQKISEDPYSEKDIALFKTISAMALPVFDRIYPYEQIKKELEATQIQLDRSQRLASLGTLAAGVAHEIRNPLGIIHSKVEKIDDEPRDLEYLRSFKESVLRNSKRISSIITNMLSLAKVKEKETKEVSLNEIIESILQLFMISRIKLIKNLQPVQNIKGDAEELKQVIINLINNAIEAMPEGGDLIIKTYQVENNVCLDIADTGKGIPGENLSKIFDPFFSTRHEGAGLGLSIVYRIIREHGGTIDVKSEVGKGSVFSIKFPAYSG